MDDHIVTYTGPGGVLRFELDRGVPLEPQDPYPSLTRWTLSDWFPFFICLEDLHVLWSTYCLENTPVVKEENVDFTLHYDDITCVHPV